MTSGAHQTHKMFTLWWNSLRFCSSAEMQLKCHTTAAAAAIVAKIHEIAMRCCLCSAACVVSRFHSVYCIVVPNVQSNVECHSFSGSWVPLFLCCRAAQKMNVTCNVRATYDRIIMPSSMRWRETTKPQQHTADGTTYKWIGFCALYFHKVLRRARDKIITELIFFPFTLTQNADCRERVCHAAKDAVCCFEQTAINGTVNILIIHAIGRAYMHAPVLRLRLLLIKSNRPDGK